MILPLFNLVKCAELNSYFTDLPREKKRESEKQKQKEICNKPLVGFYQKIIIFTIKNY